MQTIKELEDRTRQTQAKIDAENQMAQQERDKAEEFRGAGDFERAKAHSDTANKHEQMASQMHAELVDINTAQQQIQSQITELDRKQSELQISRDQELSQIANEIDRLRGGA